jgi:CRISPR-associated endonuclease/helicase Cas3
MNKKLELKDCWAKTDPRTGLDVVSVEQHCLVVGHVAKVLFAQLSNNIKSHLPEGCISIVAAHDLGKLTPGFQLKAPAWKFRDSIKKILLPDNLTTNHAIISQDHLQKGAREQGNKHSSYWYVSTGGHHGSYPLGFKPRVSMGLSEGGLANQFSALRNELLHKLIETFGPLPTDSGKDKEECVHLLTGFTIFADWIGSNSDEKWFPVSLGFNPGGLEQRALDILKRLGWGKSPKRGLSFGQLFNATNPNSFQPRPLQETLIDAADSQGLYIVEAPMGMGKTEAALSTAYKRWTQGQERGLYFALPTQLTSEKIHDRINKFLTNIVGEKDVQALVHGNAWLRDDNTKVLTPRFLEKEGGTPENEHNDTEEVLHWFSGTRKALLAPFGTGTIDQALLAVLPARFAALRYFALAGKVVVIDEVHSYDPYVSALVDRLIHYLLKAGSTVIILSATLTARRRASLVAAAGGKEEKPTTAYPLVTKVAADSPTAQYFPVREKLEPKRIRLQHQYLKEENETTYWSDVARHVEAGANVVIIRNSVSLAQQTFRLLKSLLTETVADERTGLLHSRFPRWQRTKNEDHWTGILGKDDSQRPNGSLLVSTQIVEQSVDIDADLLVTDLAPADLVLQRIGRLHRHVRNRPSGLEVPTCHLLHPETDWSGQTKEVKAALAPHGYIYPPLTLWQATTHLAKLTEIFLPGDIREILEDSSALVPPTECSPALKEFAEEYQRGVRVQAGTAKVRGVFNAVAIEDHEGRETRYNIQASSEVVLLAKKPTEQAGSITLNFQYGPPISFRLGEFSFPLAKALQLNSVRIPAYLVKNHIKSAPEWLLQHLRQGVLAILPEDGTQLKIIPEADSKYNLYYHPKTGLTHKKAAPAETSDTTAEPEDFWF